MSLQSLMQFQDFCSNNLPFGGKVVVLSGDFRQVLPVIPQASRAHVISMTILKWSAKNGEGWHDVRILTLTENMRIKRMIGTDTAEQEEFNRLVTVKLYIPNIRTKINPYQNYHYMFHLFRILMDIGNQTSPLRFGDDGPEVKYAKLPFEMFVESEEELIEQTFPNLTTERANNRAILCPLNVQVISINVNSFSKFEKYQKITLYT